VQKDEMQKIRQKGQKAEWTKGRRDKRQKRHNAE